MREIIERDELRLKIEGRLPHVSRLDRVGTNNDSKVVHARQPLDVVGTWWQTRHAGGTDHDDAGDGLADPNVNIWLGRAQYANTSICLTDIQRFSVMGGQISGLGQTAGMYIPGTYCGEFVPGCIPPLAIMPLRDNFNDINN